MAADPAVLYQRWGIYAYGKRNWPDAVDNLRRAVELDPTLSEAWYFLGLAHHSLNRLDEAVADFDSAMRCHASLACLRRRGYARVESGDYSRALEDFCAVLELDAADVETLFMSALVRVELGDLRGAVDDLTHAINRSAPGADCTDLYTLRSRLHQRLGDQVSALRDRMTIEV